MMGKGVPNAPCGVESSNTSDECFIIKTFLFLMHRVELKALQKTFDFQGFKGS